MVTLRYISAVTVVLAMAFLVDGQDFTASVIEDIRLAQTNFHLQLPFLVSDKSVGRVEVKYNGTWGSICDHDWNYFDARVACRMLGFDTAYCGTSGLFVDLLFGFTPAGTVWMDNVTCTGEENALDQCSFEGWGVPECHGLEATYAVCANDEIDLSELPSKIKLLGSTTSTLTIGWTAPRWFVEEHPESGVDDPLVNFLHEIRYESEDGTVSTARVISVPFTPEGELNYTLAFLDRDTEYKIQVRSRVDHEFCYFGYSPSGDEYYPTKFTDPITFRTNARRKPSDVSLRLVSPLPGVDFMGRVEVFRYNEWGTICDDRFSSFDERVVCGLLNYTRGGVCSAKGAAFETGEGRIWLNNLTCSESSEVIEDCNPNFLDDENSLSCSHSDDVGVICIPNEDFPPVKNLRVVGVGPTSLTLRWDQYTFPNNTVRRRFRLTAKANFTGDYGTRIGFAFGGSKTEYTFTGLELGEQYSLSLVPVMDYEQCRSSSNLLVGKYSNEVVATTMKRAPSDAPRNFRVESINKTTIEVYWRLPPLHTHGDVILGYKLFVQPVNGEETVVNIQNNETNVYTQRVYTVGGLEPATLYSFSILIYNSLGDGPRTTNLTISTMKFCTLPAEPGMCQAALPRYFFDSKTGACEKFTYGGCDGNANNFETLEECTQQCNPYDCPPYCTSEYCSSRRTRREICTIPFPQERESCDADCRITYCHACYYDDEYRSPPGNCATCDSYPKVAEADKKCFKQWAKCIRRANGRLYTKARGKSEQTEERFKCYEHPCL